MHDLCILLICFCSKIIFDQRNFSFCWDKLDYPGSIVYLFCFTREIYKYYTVFVCSFIMSIPSMHRADLALKSPNTSRGLCCWVWLMASLSCCFFFFLAIGSSIHWKCELLIACRCGLHNPARNACYCTQCRGNLVEKEIHLLLL